MTGIARALAVTGAIVLLTAPPALAQKNGGVLKFFHRDSPASGSIHEEATISAVAPFMGVFNNLVLFDQHEKQNRLDPIEPELAESWKWNDDFTRVSFRLRRGVKWHDGEPFTAADVKCTWEMLLGKSNEKLRLNPRKAWYRNLTEIISDGDYDVSFVLKRPQPAFLMLLATGMSPVYPCHVPARECAVVRSARDRSNSSSSNRTTIFASPRTRTSGNSADPISMASSGPSSRTARRRRSRLLPANST